MVRFSLTLFQVLQCDRQASDSDSGPTAENQSTALGPGRDTSDSLSRFSFISKYLFCHSLLGGYTKYYKHLTVLTKTYNVSYFLHLKLLTDLLTLTLPNTKSWPSIWILLKLKWPGIIIGISVIVPVGIFHCRLFHVWAALVEKASWVLYNPLEPQNSCIFHRSPVVFLFIKALREGGAKRRSTLERRHGSVN